MIKLEITAAFIAGIITGAYFTMLALKWLAKKLPTNARETDLFIMPHKRKEQAEIIELIQHIETPPTPTEN